MMTLLAALALAAGVPAHAEPCPDVAALCARLAAQPVLLPDAAGILPNPARASETWEALTAARLTGADPQALEQGLLPVFQALKARVAARLGAERNERRAGLVREYFDRLPLDAASWARCRRHADPFGMAASGDPPGVLVCPWLSRLTPAAAAWGLAHELGHHMDPCWNEHADQDLIKALNSIDPARGRGCAAEPDVEAYADRIGAELLSELVETGGLPLPPQPDLRAAALLQHYLQPGCSTPRQEPSRLETFLTHPPLVRALCAP
jgi:hypothetical protein